jgi:hypothetical protein
MTRLDPLSMLRCAGPSTRVIHSSRGATGSCCNPCQVSLRDWCSIGLEPPGVERGKPAPPLGGAGRSRGFALSVVELGYLDGAGDDFASVSLVDIRGLCRRNQGSGPDASIPRDQRLG